MEKKLSALEMRVLRTFWSEEPASIREAHERIAKEEESPEYTTFQTIVGRLEGKGALKRVKKMGNAWLFQAAISKQSLVSKLVDDIVGLLDGTATPIVSHLMQSGKLSKEDLDRLEQVAQGEEPIETNESEQSAGEEDEWSGIRDL